MIKPIFVWPDAVLKQKSEPVTDFGEPFKQLTTDLLQTCKEAHGAGLAAIQIGELKRVFVVDLSGSDSAETPHVYTNPVITPVGTEKVSYKEGCLSIPGVWEAVTRFQTVKIDYTDLDGKPATETATGLKAVAIQHEFDHLEGVCITDTLSQLKRSMAKSKTAKFMKKTIRRYKAAMEARR